MQLKSQRDFVSGLVFAGAGAAFALASTAYPIGTGLEMGPGYFPLLLGALLALLGAAVMYRSLAVETVDASAASGHAGTGRSWRPLFCVAAANLAFGVLLAGLPALAIPPMGLVPAVFALTLLASLAHREFRLMQALLLALALAVGAQFVLLRLLKLPLVAWPAFLGG